MKSDLFDSKIRIIQSSRPRTGSTLLANILLGLFCDKCPLKFLQNLFDDSNKFIFNKNFIIKTHSCEFEKIKKYFSEYDIYYIESIRIGKPEHPLFDESRHLKIDYSEFANKDTNLKPIIIKIAEKVSSFLPDEICSFINIDLAHDRIKNMNLFYENKLKNMSWGEEFDDFYALHGRHKNRDS